MGWGNRDLGGSLLCGVVLCAVQCMVLSFESRDTRAGPSV